MKDSLTTLLCDLENQLLQPEVRESPNDIDRLLADEFVEFGASGTIYRKPQCAGGMSSVRMSLSHFDAKILAPGVALTTYRVVKHDEPHPHMKHSLRSSIWKLMDGRWQMVFHQGTPTAAPDE
ncbi:MAG: DUF4440 domain-containing protein [Planctomycetota bacterium]|nr:DUF4440 domain-containing protein [Planctomycetota bacterium]